MQLQHLSYKPFAIGDNNIPNWYNYYLMDWQHYESHGWCIQEILSKSWYWILKAHSFKKIGHHSSTSVRGRSWKHHPTIKSYNTQCGHFLRYLPELPYNAMLASSGFDVDPVYKYHHIGFTKCVPICLRGRHKLMKPGVLMSYTKYCSTDWLMKGMNNGHRKWENQGTRADCDTKYTTRQENMRQYFALQKRQLRKSILKNKELMHLQLPLQVLPQWDATAHQHNQMMQ